MKFTKISTFRVTGNTFVFEEFEAKVSPIEWIVKVHFPIESITDNIEMLKSMVAEHISQVARIALDPGQIALFVLEEFNKDATLISKVEVFDHEDGIVGEA